LQWGFGGVIKTKVKYPAKISDATQHNCNGKND
jgi:hypothetical protein